MEPQELAAALQREVARLPLDGPPAPNAWTFAVPAPDAPPRSVEPALATAALDALEQRGLFAAGPVTARVVVDPALAPGQLVVTGTVERGPAPARPAAGWRLVPVLGDQVRWGAAATAGGEQAVALAPGATELGPTVLRHPSVRERHACLDLSPDGRLQVRATHPHAALHLDGRPVRQAALQDGSRLRVGEVELVVRGPAPDAAGARRHRHGPFARGLRRTPLVLWLATALMVLGTAGAGTAAVLVGAHRLLAAGTGAVSVVIGVAGVVLGVRRGILEDVT